MDQCLKLWQGYVEGAWGAYGQAERDYQSFCALHNVGQILVAANSKKHKPTPPPSFKEYAPRLYEFITGQDSAEDTTNKDIQSSILAMFKE